MSVLLHRIALRAAARRDVDRAVARALGESTGSDRLTTEPPTAGGDEERLRGIPVIGGTTGAIRGSIPGRSRRLDEWGGRT